MNCYPTNEEMLRTRIGQKVRYFDPDQDRYVEAILLSVTPNDPRHHDELTVGVRLIKTNRQKWGYADQIIRPEETD